MDLDAWCKPQGFHPFWWLKRPTLPPVSTTEPIVLTPVPSQFVRVITLPSPKATELPPPLETVDIEALNEKLRTLRW